MIEIATGAAFLMSSLYGAGQANAAAPDIAPPQAEQATAAEAQPLDVSKDIEAYVREQYADEPILVDIARCESAFRQYGSGGKAIRGEANPADVGVMQINEKYHAAEAAKLGYDIYETKGNVAFAKHLYEKYGIEPWISSEKCWSSSGDLARK
ncbi:MAG: hypothetical protein ABSF56_02955 [Minisyncoccia bacterium]